MGRLATFVLGAIPLSPSAGQAVKATVADWRHEAARTPHPFARTVVALWSMLALLRVLAGSAIREFPAEARSPFLWRVAIGTVVTVGALGFIEPMYPTVAKGVGAFTLMSLAQGLYLGAMFLPLVVFAAEVTGSSTRRAPSLGSALAITIAVLVWVAIVTPETFNLMWTIHRWGRPDVIAPVPSLVRWFTGEPTREMSSLFLLNRGIAWIAFTVEFWSLAVLAYRIRTFAAGPRVRRMAIVWCSVLAGTVVIPTFAILPLILPDPRLPYWWTLLALVASVGAFCVAGVLARRTDARAKALAVQMTR